MVMLICMHHPSLCRTPIQMMGLMEMSPVSSMTLQLEVSICVLCGLV